MFNNHDVWACEIRMWIAYEATYDECTKYCFRPALTKYVEGADLRLCVADKFNKNRRTHTHTHIYMFVCVCVCVYVCLQ